MLNFQTARSAFRLLHNSRCGLYMHEYQAYDLLKKYQLNLVPVTVPLNQGYRATTPEDAFSISQRMMANVSKNKPFVDIVIKAQVHAGGRGKGYFKESGLKGGVQIATKAEEVKEYCDKMLGKTLITHQTGSIGKRCNEVFLVEKIYLRKELYLSLTLDRSRGMMAVITSEKGGVNIEDVEASKMHKFFFELGEDIPLDVL
jgi:succinyl-CoA synthetase beta subunit